MDLNKNNIKKILGIIVFAVLFALGCAKIGVVAKAVKWLLHILMPFILGGAMAFIINVLMKFIEERWLFWIKKEKVRRTVAIILSFVLIVAVVGVVLVVVVPEVISSVVSIVKLIPSSSNKLIKWLNEVFGTADIINDTIRKVSEEVSSILKALTDHSSDIMKTLYGMLDSTFGIVSGTINGIVNFFIGLIFAIYILFSKESLAVQSKKLLYAYVPEKKADRVSEIMSLSNRVFHNFIAGQCIEAVILGAMFFVVMSVLQMPYVLMISMLIALTALIPIVGCFVGCAVGALLIFIESPKQALIFVIIFFILQQIEGNLIYPHVVGSSIGLPSMWVLFAVTVGGSLMGVVGMLVLIPAASVLYALLRVEVGKRLEKNNIPPEKYAVMPHPSVVRLKFGNFFKKKNKK